MTPKERYIIYDNPKRISHRDRAELFEKLRAADLEEIALLTGCLKPCQYRKYHFVKGKERVGLKFEDFAFSLWAVSKKTTIKTEQLIYPITSLVADFGGTLGLFLGFSFITLWDSLLVKACTNILQR